MENKSILRICYGTKNTTLNKGNENMILTDEDLAFIVQSISNNKKLKVLI